MNTSTEDLIQATMTDLTMSGSGFATLPDGRQIFLPSSVVKGSGANIGDVLACKVVPNYEDRRSENVPWRAFFVQKVREPGDEVPELDAEIASDILENLRTEGPATIGQLLVDIFEEDESKNPHLYRQLGDLVNQMYREGKVAKAQIFKPGAARPRYTFYAATSGDLMPTEEAALPDMS